MKRFTIFSAILLFGVVMVGVATGLTSVVSADVTPSLLTEYPVPGSPQNIVVESPGHVWFTLPAQNAIGRLVVTSTVEYTVITYTVPTANSEPYDLDYEGGTVWFTERAGNKIGRLDETNGGIDEFLIPTAKSAPTGISVAQNGQVWFTERNANNLARLTVTSTLDYAVAEFPFGIPSGQLQDVVVENNDSIWFTAPGVDRLANFKPTKWPSPESFGLIPAGGGSKPWSVVMGSGSVWITAYGASRIGRYTPQTQSDWRWYSLTTGSGPTGIAFDVDGGLNRVWFVERDGGRVGRLNTKPDGTPVGIWEWPLPPANSQPQGIAVDSNGHVWIAESAANRIAEWRPPYLYSIYMPVVLRQ